MGNSRSHRLFRHIVDIKPEEQAIALWLFLYFFLITAPFTILKSLRTAVFLDKLGPGSLPIAYATAVLMGLVVAFHSKLQFSLTRRRLILSSLMFFIITGLFFFILFQFGGKWIALLYWVWLSVFILVLVTQFWIVMNDIFNPREAKRLIGFIGSGGILGGVLGGLLVRILAKSNEDYHLIPVAVVFLIIGTVVANQIFVWKKRQDPFPQTSTPISDNPTQEPSKTGFKTCYTTVKNDSYLILIAMMIITGAMVSTFIDWQFNKVMTLNDAIKENMTAFFGLFYAALFVIPFLFQLLFTSHLIRRFKLRVTLLLYPVILLICSLGIAVWPILLFGIIIKGSDKSLAFSINQSSRELLYIPVTPGKKYQAKTFIDMFLVRFAESCAALILALLLIFFSHRSQIAPVSAVSALFIALWIGLNLKVYQAYINTVKESIKPKWKRADKDVAEKLDMDYAKLIFDTIASRDRSSVLYAMHMYDLLRQDKLTPEIKALITQKADEVKAASISDMFNAEGAMWFPDADDGLQQEDLKASIQEIISSDAYQQVMQLHADQVMEESKRADIDKMELAKVIGMMDPNSPLAEKLEALIHDDSPEVARYAIESAALLKKPEHLPALIQKLKNPPIREDAISALIKYGREALGAIDAYLGDHNKAIELRRALVTALSRMGTQESTDLLLKELERKASDLDTEIIDALDRIRSERPEVYISPKIVKQETLALIKKYCKTFLELEDLKSGKKDDELRILLQKRLNIHFVDVFKLLGLTYPHEDISKAYQNIGRGTKDSMANAIELLDNTLKKDLRDLIIPLIEDLTTNERVRRFGQILRNFPKF